MKPVFSLLGPLTAAVDGTPIELGGQKRRALLAALLLKADKVVASLEQVTILSLEALFK